MGAQLKIHKVDALPEILEANALYMHKDQNDVLVLTQTDKVGEVYFSTVDTAQISSIVNDTLADSPIVSGPRLLNLNETGSYYILNYSANIEYVVSAEYGDVTIDGDTITYKAPAIGKVAGFMVNSGSVGININNPSYVTTPAITNPINNATDLGPSIEVASSIFNSIGEEDSHVSTDWQVATDELFNDIILYSNANTINKTSWTLGSLPINTTFYMRTRYRGAVLGYSDWSNIIVFTTAVIYITKPSFIDIDTGTTNVGSSRTVTLSEFNLIAGTAEHAATDWQIATNSNFTNIAIESLDSNDLLSYNIASLNANTTYYLRARFKTNLSLYSAYTDTVQFSTKVTFDTQPVQPSIVSPIDSTDDLGPDLTIVSTAFSVLTGIEEHTSSNWQIASDTGFNNIVYQSIDDTVNKTSINVTNLPVNTTLYIRVRHTGITLGASEWSNTISIFTKASYSNSPNTPAITSPTNNAVDILNDHTFTSSIFAVGSGSDTHASSDWQIASDSEFNDIILSISASASNKTSWTPDTLACNGSYYVRVRYNGSYTGASEWSTPIGFTTAETYITTPSIISPANEAIEQTPSITITSSAYTSNYTGDIHTSSDWEVATDSDFEDMVASSYASSTDLVSFDVSGLDLDTTYYVRVRYTGTNGGISSWSSTSSFTTISELVSKPSITSPSNGVTNVGPTLTITSSAFSAADEQTQAKAHWQVATDDQFSATILDIETSNSLEFTSYSVTNIPSDSTLYIRVRHQSNLGYWSDWSIAIIAYSSAHYISKPSITSPVTGATDLGPGVTFTSDAFSSTVSGETHVSSDWQLASDAGFTTIVRSATGSTTDKTSWTVADLDNNTTYYARVRYNGSSSL